MKKITLYSSLAIGLLMLFVMPGVIAVSDGGGITPNINVTEFAPRVWMCDSRVVYDDGTEPGRISLDGEELVERINNYAFEGEQIHWTVLVMDKNKIDQNIDVYATIGDSQGEGNDIEANCIRAGNVNGANTTILPSCNARIDEEILTTYDPNVMDYFECTLTVETGDPTNPNSMYGEYWITVEASDGDKKGTMDENEYWFFNPIVALGVDTESMGMDFENTIPGADSYSNTILIKNDAEESSGVMMDMFISGTDFYDSSSSGARCPTTNQLSLSAFKYFATNGAYSTQDAYGASYTGPTADTEGYKGIIYGIGFNNPNPFYNEAEIVPVQQVGPYYIANLLAPGAEMALTFKLSLPEPCTGNFDTGSINFWGEAI